MSPLSILYRGPLSSCNYGCAYCPFAKRKESRAELARDRAALARFVAWVRAREAPVSILFTPWGEALVRRAYREAMVELSRLPHVRRVAAQTNLSFPAAEMLAAADPTRLALWCTYHPEWTDRGRFLARCRALSEAGVRYSVGMVGFRKFIPEIEAMRAALPAEVYLWVNAVKAEPYVEDDVRAIEAVDPLFRVNTVRHPSRGRACGAGETVISVDGDGDVRRCHFIRDEIIANLYDGTLDDALRPRRCPEAVCGCHIGYVHMDHLGLRPLFGEGLLERIPDGWPMSAAGADTLRAHARALTRGRALVVLSA
ncbi:MAG: radical SAM/SPASM domain-containing protein [Myxococcales bacterium]|nr:radical SAM/SPASM domain-containing protein [Myxococcales bacterium]